MHEVKLGIGSTESEVRRHLHRSFRILRKIDGDEDHGSTVCLLIHECYHLDLLADGCAGFGARGMPGVARLIC